MCTIVEWRQMQQCTTRGDSGENRTLRDDTKIGNRHAAAAAAWLNTSGVLSHTVASETPLDSLEQSITALRVGPSCQFSNWMSSSQFQCHRDVINDTKVRIGVQHLADGLAAGRRGLGVGSVNTVSK